MAKVIYKLDDDISTDIIYPGIYGNGFTNGTPAFAFDDIRELDKNAKR